MVFIDQSLWQSPQTARLASALVAIRDEAAMQAFLSDVLTEKEIIEVSARFEAACMLSQGAKYEDIIEATGLSSRTVARISDWLKNGAGGYAVALSAVEHHEHTLPARAA